MCLVNKYIKNRFIINNKMIIPVKKEELSEEMMTEEERKAKLFVNRMIQNMELDHYT